MKRELGGKGQGRATVSLIRRKRGEGLYFKDSIDGLDSWPEKPRHDGGNGRRQGATRFCDSIVSRISEY